MRAPLMVTLFGTALVCLAAAAAARTIPAVAGAGAYLVGAVAVTAARNVPINDAVAGLDPREPGVEQVWVAHRDRWTRWNHVRTVACGAATVLFAVALTE